MKKEETKNNYEDIQKCDVCEDDCPKYLDTGMTRYQLCYEHLFELVTFTLKPKNVKKLREQHGNEDLYLGKEFYDKQGKPIEEKK